MGKHAKLKEKQKWSNEKIHLENARRLRGIYFIDPEDKVFKETIKNVRRKLETPVAPAVLCKTSEKSKHGETRSIFIQHVTHSCWAWSRQKFLWIVMTLLTKIFYLQQYGERIEKLSQPDRVSKFCMDAGFLNVVEIGQCVMTKDTA